MKRKYMRHAQQSTDVPVAFVNFEEQRKDENLFLIRDIDKKMKDGAVFSDFAVLFRTNTQPQSF